MKTLKLWGPAIAFYVMGAVAPVIAIVLVTQ